MQMICSRYLGVVSGDCGETKEGSTDNMIDIAGEERTPYKPLLCNSPTHDVLMLIS